MRTRASALGLALVVMIASGVVTLAAAGTPLSPEQRIARVTQDLASLRQEVQQLREELARVPATAAELPSALRRDIAALRPHWEAVIDPLRGLPWKQVRPVLDDAQRLLSDIAALVSDLAAWKPFTPPAEPAHEVRTATGTGAISGMVWDAATGQPMAHVEVRIHCDDPYADFDVETDANGSFLASDLAAGTYDAAVTGMEDYVGELYDAIVCGNVCSWYEPTPIAVVEGETTTGVDFPLYHFSSIAGTITDEATGLPVAGLRVGLWELYQYPPGWSAVTDEAGVFQFTDLVPGTYFATSSDYLYVGELYDDLPCDPTCDPEGGDPVTVAPGQDINGIDFALERKGTISGTLTDEVTGAAIEGIYVYIYDASGTYRCEVESDGEGNFTTCGLFGGTYFVKAVGSDSYVTELYDDIQCFGWCDPTTGTPVTVTMGSDTPGVDFSLQTYATFSGTVTDRASETPLDAWVEAVDSAGDYRGGDYTDSQGHYAIGGLEGGTYFAVASSHPHLDQLYQDIPCYSDCDPTAGTPIAVGIGEETTGIDFALDLGGSISGTVTAAAGGPLVGSVYVSVFDADGSSLGYWGVGTGEYTVDGLPPGSYFARAWSDGRYAGVLYDGILCEPSCDVTGGTPIPVAMAEDTSGIDFSLPRMGWISGTVTDLPSGLPLAEAYVMFYDAAVGFVGSTQTDGDGVYSSAGLAAGTYFVLVMDYNWGHRGTVYEDLPCPGMTCDPASGTPVTVTLATETTGIDIVMPRYGSISGTVAESLTGVPIPDVGVRLFDAAGDQRTYTQTDEAGTYSFIGLDTGTYYLTTTNSLGYLNEVFDNIECEPSCEPMSGTPIAVTMSVETAGVDFYLHRPFFADVPRDHWARSFIEALYAAGVTAGCSTSPRRYCPATWVTRDQSAVLLLRSEEGEGYVPPPAVGMFDDVPVESPYAPWIEELGRRGITAGCGGGNFCPGDPLTRRQAAVLLLRTADGAAYVPPPATGVFEDVPVESPYAPWIEELARRGITAGCSVDPPLFCPDVIIHRAQGAVFLVRTFELPPVR